MRAAAATFFFLTTFLCFGVEPPDERTGKYFEILERRPESRPLFDRFRSSWLDAGTVEDLRAFLEQRIEENPNSATVRIHATVLQELGEVESALETLSAGAERFPDDPGLLVQLAEQQLRLQQTDLALDALDAAEELNPEAELAIRIAELEGAALLRIGDSEAALEVWRNLLEANPGDDELRVDVIDLLAAEGLIDEALAASEVLIERTPDPYDRALRQSRHAELLRQGGFREQAIDLYRQLLLAAGAQTWLECQVLSRIDGLFRSEDEIEGLRDFLIGLRDEQPQRIAVRANLARVFAALREEDAAIGEYRELLKITPGDRSVREGFVNLLGSLKRFEEGAEEVGRLVEQHPRDAELVVLLAQMRHWSGDNLGAAESVRQFLAIGVAEEHRYLRAARLLESFQLGIQAEKTLRESVEKFPDSISAKETLADFLYRVDQSDEALKIWSELANSEDLGTTLRVIRSVASRGHAKEAFAWLEARNAEFQAEPRFLEAFLTRAVFAGEFEKAAASVRPLLRMAGTPFDLDRVIELVLKIGRYDEIREKLIADLEGSEFPQEICARAALISEAGNLENAIAELEQLLAESPDELAASFALNQMATLYQRDFQRSKAVETMARLVSRPGGKKTAYLQRLVQLCRGAGQIEEALKWLREWKPLSPANPQIWLEEGEALFELGRFEESFRVMRQAIGRFEDDERFPSKLAAFYLETGLAEDAEQLFWRLYDRSENDRDRLTWARRLNEATRIQGTTDRLIEKLEERSERNRGSVGPRLALAEIHRLNRDEENWRATLQAALAVDPSNTELLMAVKRSHEAQANWEEAIAVLETALKHDKTGQAKRELPALLLKAGRTEEALRLIEEAIAESGGARLDVKPLIAGLLEFVTMEEAANFVDRILSRQPDDFQLHYLSGVLWELCEDDERAAAAFRRVLNLPPSFPPQGHVKPRLSTGAIPLPEEIKRFAAWLQYGEFAYNYRRGARRGRLYLSRLQLVDIGYGNQGLGTVTIPDSTLTAQVFALEHLARLGALEQETAETLGISDLFLDLLRARYSDPEFDLTSAIRARVKEDELAAAAWLATMSGSSTTYFEAANRLRENWPEAALQAALKAMSDPKDEVRDLCRQLLAEVKFEATETLFAVCAAIQWDRGRNPDGADSELRRALRDKVASVLLRWADEDAEKFRSVLSNSVHLLAVERDFDLLVSILGLVEEVERKFPRQLASFRASDEPYTMIPGFPLNLLQPLYQGQTEFAELKTEDWRAMGARLESPALKFWCAYFEGEARIENPEKFVADPADSTASALVAAYFEKSGETHRALEILVAAAGAADSALAEVTLDHRIRQLLWNSRIEAENLPPELRSGVESVLARLAIYPLDTREEKEALANLLERFGMPAEAKRVSRRSIAIRSGSSRGTIFPSASSSLGFTPVSSNSTGRFATEKAKLLLLENDVEGAARVLAQPARRVAAAMLNSTRNSEGPQLLAVLNESPALKEALLAQMKPDADAPARERALFAALNEFANEKEAAIELYRELLAEAPEDDVLRLRLVLNHVREGETEAALEHFRRLDASSHGVVFQKLERGQGGGIQLFLDLAELAAKWLENADEDALKGSLTWAQSHWQALHGQLADEQLQLAIPALSMSESESTKRRNQLPEAKRKIYERFMAERLEKIELLGQAMLAAPRLEKNTHRILYLRRREAGKPPTTDDFERVERILLEEVSPPEESFQSAQRIVWAEDARYSQSLIRVRSVDLGFDDNPIPQFEHADELNSTVGIAADIAFRTNRPRWIPDRLIPRLKAAAPAEGYGQKIIRKLDLLNRFHFCEPDEFTETLNVLLREEPDQATQTFESALWVHSLRGLESDLTDSLVELARLMSEENRGVREIESQVHKVVSAILDQPESYKKTQQLLTALGEIFVGPKTDLELWKRTFDQQSEEYRIRGAAFAQLLSRIQQLERQTTGWILDFAAKHGIEGSTRRFNYRISSIRELPAAQILETANGLATADLKRFDPHIAPDAMLESDRQNHCFLLNYYFQLTTLRAANRKELVETLEAQIHRDRDAFGEQLLAAVLSENPASRFAEVFVEHEKQILALEEERIRDLAFFCGQFVEVGGGGSVDAPAWVVEAQKKNREEALERFLSYESYSDLPDQSYNSFEDTVASYALLSMKLGRDPAEVFEQVDRLLETIQASRSRRGSSYSKPELLAAIYMKLMNQTDLEPASVMRLARIGVSLSESGVERLQAYHIRRPLERWSERAGRGMPKVDLEERLVPQLEAMIEAGAENDVTRALLPLAMIDVSRRVDDSLKTWAREEAEKSDGARREALEAFAIAEDREAMARSELIESAFDESLPGVVRETLLKYWNGVLSSDAPPDFLFRTARLIIENWESDSPDFDPELAGEILDKLSSLEDHDEERNRVAKSLGAAWSQVRPSIQSGRQPETPFILKLIDLQLSAGESAMAVRIARRHQRAIRDWGELLAKFVRNRDPSAARWSALELRKNYQRRRIRDRYDDEFHASAEEFLTTISSSDERLFLRFVFSSMSDDSGSSAPKQRQRLMRLAEEFSNAKAVSSEVRDWVLSGLASDGDLLELIAPQLEAWARLNPLNRVAGREVASPVKPVVLWNAIWKSRAERSGLKPLLDSAAELKRTAGNQKLIGGFQSALSEVILEFLTEAESEKRSQLVGEATATFREFATAAAVDPSSGIDQDIFYINLVLHIFADELEAYDRWHETLAETAMVRMESALQKNPTQSLRALADLMGENHEDAEALILRFQERREQLSLNSSLRRDFFSRINSYGLIPNAAFLVKQELEIGIKLAEAWPRDGYAWVELANLYQQEGQLEQARACIARALEFAEDADEKDVQRWRRMAVNFDPANFLETENIHDVVENDSQFRSRVVGLVNDLLRKDRADEALKVYLHGVSLIDRQVEAGTPWISGQNNGWSPSGDMLFQIAKSGEGLALLEMITRAFAEDSESKIAHPGTQNEFKTAVAVRKTFVDAGGNYSPEQGLQQLLTELHRRLGDVHPGLLAIEFWNLMEKNIGFRGRIRVIAWADAVAETDPLRPLARELTMAARAYVWEKEPKFTGRRDVVPQLESFREHYFGLIQDEEIPLGWRISLCRHLVEKISDWDDEFSRAIGELAIGGLEREAKFIGRTLSQVLLQYCRVPADERWLKSVDQLNQLWMGWQDGDPETARVGRAHRSPEANAVIAMLKINVRAGNKEIVDEQLKLFARHNPQNWAALLTHFVEAEWPGHAAAQLAHEGEDEPRFFVTFYNDTTWTDEIAARLPGVLAAIENEGRRFYAEVAVNSFPDPAQSREIEISTPKAERLKALTPRFGEIAFPSEKMERQTFHILAKAPLPALRGFEDELAKRSGPRTIAEAAGPPWNEFGTRFYMRPIRGLVRIQLLRGESNLTLETLAQFGMHDPDRPANWREAWKEFSYALVDAAYDAIDESSEAEVVDAILLSLESLLTKSPDSLADPEAMSRAVAAYLITCARTDQVDRANAWFDRLSEPERDRIRKKRIWVHGLKLAEAIAFTLAKLGGGEDAFALDADERFEFVRTFQSARIFREEFNLSPSWFQYLAMSGAVGPGEWLGRLEPLVESAPRGGRSALEAAAFCLEAKDFEKAEAWLERALADAGAENVLKIRLKWAGQVCFYVSPEKARPLVQQLLKRRSELASGFQSELTRLQAATGAAEN